MNDQPFSFPSFAAATESILVRFADGDGPRGGGDVAAMPVVEGTSAKLFVGSLPLSVTEEELRAMFVTYGELLPDDGLHILPPKGNRGHACAFVKYSSAASAAAAIA